MSQRFIDYIFDKYHVDASHEDIRFNKDVNDNDLRRVFSGFFLFGYELFKQERNA